MVFLNLTLLLAGLILLIFGAGWFVDGSVAISQKYRISEMVIGLTILGFGTSMPEFFVNVMASVHREAEDIVSGNVIGSNIFNLFMILGLSGIIRPLTIQRSIILKEAPVSLFAIMLLLVLANDRLLFGATSDMLGRIDGALMLLFFGAFLFDIFRTIRSEKHLMPQSGMQSSSSKTILLLIFGLAALLLGGKLMVDSAVKLAIALNINTKLIALTILSTGTSLPELATSITAARKGNTNLAVGNVIGSNIFNIFFILGASLVIRPVNYNLDFNTDGLVLIAGTLFLLIASFVTRGVLNRWAAIVLFSGYGFYLTWLIYDSWPNPN